MRALERAAWEALHDLTGCLVDQAAGHELPEGRLFMAAVAANQAIGALLAAEPEAEPRQPFFHRLGCPMAKGYQSSTAAHCTCAESPAKRVEMRCGDIEPQYAPVEPPAAAPDAELERRSQRGPGGKPVSELERLFGIAWELGRAAGESGKPYSQEALSEYALLWTEVEHEIQRREAAARGEVVGTAVLCKNLGSPILVNIHVEPGVTGPHSGIPVTLTRRAE